LSNKDKNIIIALLSLLILLMVFWAGWNTYPKYHPVFNDTILVRDTVTRHITDSFPYYIAKTDTVIKRDTVKITDTVKILGDYFALHYVSRKWEDSLLTVNLRDVITENKVIGNDFNYTFKKPFINVVNNEISYRRYIMLGLNTTGKSVGMDALYVFGKGYVSFGYEVPLNAFKIGAGITVIKFK
jgi:hypothetical protein